MRHWQFKFKASVAFAFAIAIAIVIAIAIAIGCDSDNDNFIRLDWITLCLSHWFRANIRISCRPLFDTIALILAIFWLFLVLLDTCTRLKSSAS